MFHYAYQGLSRASLQNPRNERRQLPLNGGANGVSEAIQRTPSRYAEREKAPCIRRRFATRVSQVRSAIDRRLQCINTKNIKWIRK